MRSVCLLVCFFKSYHKRPCGLAVEGASPDMYFRSDIPVVRDTCGAKSENAF